MKHPSRKPHEEGDPHLVERQQRGLGLRGDDEQGRHGYDGSENA